MKTTTNLYPRRKKWDVVVTAILCLVLGNDLLAERHANDDERSIDDPRVQHRSYEFGGPGGEEIPYAIFVPSTYDQDRSAS